MNNASGSPNASLSNIAYLDWSARLKVTVLTEDGRPLEGAWVYIVDAYSGGNVTAALTDENGNAGILFVNINNAAAPLRIEPGDRVDIGFSLLRGWFWLDGNRRLTGESVNPEWDPVLNNVPPQPIGNEYIQYVSFKGRTGWARFFGKYIVMVYYKPGGGDLNGPVDCVLVFDSFNDEAHHRYIYLGILPEGSGADYSASQSKIFRVNVGDMILFFKDAEGRPLGNVHVVLDKWGISGYSDDAGRLRFEKMPRISYTINAEWTSRYNSKAFLRTPVEGGSTITMPVYDISIQIITPKGNPVINADVYLEDVYLGITNWESRVLATQVPIGSYKLSAKWLGSNLILQRINVTTGNEIVITPSNVHSLTIMVRGVVGQALEGASVTIFRDSVEIMRRVTDRGGNVEVELPDGEYVIEASFDQFQKRKLVVLKTDSFERIDLDVFVKVLGVSMTLSQTLFLALGIIMVILLLAVIIHEYHVYRRKRIPQLFIVRRVE
ncbi:MAG: carboxypeptidase-like regulatory domain-containing protein [Thermoproteota archaeon]